MSSLPPQPKRTSKFFLAALLARAAPSFAEARARREDVRAIDRHIRKKWRELTRNPAEAALAGDPKFVQASRPTIYVSQRENIHRARRTLAEMVSPADLKEISIRRLDPKSVASDPQGLLFVPNLYVVPGGRFNEMYGWDSFFMQKGLLRCGEHDLARWMTENHLYQVRHYGRVLNAGRLWSVTRSQPPVLTPMILDTYRQHGDDRWLARAMDTAEKYHRFWNRGGRLVRTTGLSRYFDDGHGPSAEVTGAGPGEYERARSYFLERSRGEDVSRYYDLKKGELTAHFFKGERACRESGYDTTARFGPFGADTHLYNPVDLNCLLYSMERDLAEMARRLGRRERAEHWERAAEIRGYRIRKSMWDEEHGLFFDHHIPSGERSDAIFASTFFPLWSGVATPYQAARVVENLPLLEAPGGLLTSDRRTGHQWDAPVGWAPLLYFAVTGLRRYGYHAEADRLSVSFLSLVLQEFRAHGEIFEKYDVVERSSNTSRSVEFGYTSNEAGFGWTNGVVSELYAALPARERRRVAA